MLKRLVFPITPLVVISASSIIFTIWALIIVFTGGPTAALIGGIAVGITAFIAALYMVDRILIRKIAYKTVLLTEFFLIILISFFFYYEESTIDINIATDKNYFIVLFDSEENLLADFDKNGIFGKQLYLNNNIIHLDSSLYNDNNLRIIGPDIWEEFTQYHGAVQINGDLVKYIIRTTNDNPQLRLDSLLNEIEIKSLLNE